jgi:hypothetical protein
MQMSVAIQLHFFYRKKISNSFQALYSGNASAFSTFSHREIISDEDCPRTPKAPSIYAIRSSQSDVTCTSLCSSKDVSLWKIIQAQQQQLNRIQDQIDRLILAVGGLPPKRESPPSYDHPYSGPSRMAISSAPASLAITAGPERNPYMRKFDDADDDDSDILMSEEVAKLVRKYSTKLRE